MQAIEAARQLLTVEVPMKIILHLRASPLAHGFCGELEKRMWMA